MNRCPRWHFWNPKSGFLGGCIAALLLDFAAFAAIYVLIHL